ncbi:MAG TPA: ATP-binding protein [Polyangiaceae bacterium]|nr:ATP-binding protein [Polyangiaceae bacterium]
MNYDWPRFWFPWDGQLQLDEDGFSPDPDGHFRFLNLDLLRFEQLQTHHCLVLLGPPGMGKSTALRAAHDASTASEKLLIDLASYSDQSSLEQALFNAEQVRSWLESDTVLHLFVDSLDECHVRTVAKWLLERLQSLPKERLRLRLACRTSELPAQFSQQALHELWSEQGEKRDVVRFVELAPLRRKDVEDAAARHGIDPGQFVEAIRRVQAGPLAARPITLDLLLRLYLEKQSLPTTRNEVYHRGCLKLTAEWSPQRADAGLVGRLSPQQRLAVAKRIAAVSIFCGRASILREEPPMGGAADDISAYELSGGTELANGSAVTVDEAAIREALGTGLFSSRGGGRLGWAHQSYAEYLAAQYLSDHGVFGRRLRELLFHHEDRHRTIPQLREVAAWLASMRRELLDELIRCDPQVLLRSDQAILDTPARASLIARLLEGFERQELLDDWWEQRYDYRKLQHPGLAQQLRPVLADRTKSDQVRGLAIEIAQACQDLSLVEDLICLALDSSQPRPVREDAVRALTEIGDEGTRSRLRPLIGIEPRDPSDSLPWLALSALCPTCIGPVEALGLLPEPTTDATNYDSACSRLFFRLGGSSEAPGLIERRNLSGALNWLTQQLHDVQHPVDVYHTHLWESITRLGWQHAEDPEVASTMAQVAVELLLQSQSLLAPERSLLGERLPCEIETPARHSVLRQIVGTDNLWPEEGAWRFASSSPPLLRAEDLDWAVSAYHAESASSRRERWADVIYRVVLQNPPRDAGNGIDDGPVAVIVRRASADSARKATLALRIEQELQASVEATAPRTTPEQAVLAALEDVEEGRIDEWIPLTTVMWNADDDSPERPPTDHGGALWLSPTWQKLSDAARGRVVEAAKVFLERADPRNEEWFAQSWCSPAAAAGHAALELILNQDAGWLSDMSRSLWQRWLPSTVRNTHSRVELVARGYQVDPSCAVNCLRHALELENRGGSIHSHHKFDSCWDEHLADALLYIAGHPAAMAQSAAELVAQGIEHGDERFWRYSLSQLTSCTSSENPLRALAVVAAGAVAAPEGAWPPILRAMQALPKLADALLPVLAGRLHEFDHARRPTEGLQRRFKAFARRLSARQLEALYGLLERRTPLGEADKGRRAGSSPLEELRRELFEALIQRADSESVAALARLADGFPDRGGLKRGWLQTKQAWAEQTWLRPKPPELLRLIQQPTKGLVQSGDQLLDLVVESLDRLQGLLQGETPLAEFLWNEQTGGRAPKAENSISNFVKSHLDRDLKERGIVLNREVEIRRTVGRSTGQRTDIQIVATVKDAHAALDAAGVIVEIKGCWNPRVCEDLTEQLRDRYLRRNDDCRYGLYLVAWFGPGCSREGKNCRWSTAAEARDHFEGVAERASTAEVKIRAFVLDGSFAWGAPTRLPEARKRKHRPRAS